MSDYNTPGRHSCEVLHFDCPEKRRKIWGDLMPVELYTNRGEGRHRAPDVDTDTQSDPTD